jgi:hypothetical protein
MQFGSFCLLRTIIEFGPGAAIRLGIRSRIGEGLWEYPGCCLVEMTDLIVNLQSSFEGELID